MKTTLATVAVATALLFSIPTAAEAFPGKIAVSSQVKQSDVVKVHRRGWRHRHYRRHRYYRPYGYYGGPYYRPYRYYGGYPYYRRGPRVGFFIGF